MNRKVKPWIVATFLLPGLLMYGYFFFIPAIQSFYYSLTEWNGFKAEKVFIGLDNFISLLHDKTFLQALGNTMLFLLLGGVLIFSIALLFTYLITRPGFRGRKAFSNFFYFPNMISQAALAVLWVFFFNPEFGLLNMVLEAIGLGEWCIPWLGSRMSGMVCIIAVSCISFVGFYLILLLSGCDKIPNTYQEAASIDGATDLVCFFKITLGILGWVLMSSFKTNLEIYQTPWAMPAKATLENYHSAWSTMKMSSYFMNSVVIVFASILGCTVISALTSFALTRYEFKGRKALLNLLIFSMSVPSQLLLIPLYDQLLNLGLVNTRTGLILIYIALYFPFSLFVLTGFFRTLPKELEESAIIDGCGEFRMFARIMLPLVQPGLICISVFNFVSIWNEYMLALVFASKQNLRTISLGMYALKDSMMYTSNWGGLFAAIVIMLIPTIIIFLTLQKYVIQGLTLGAVKG